MVTLRSKKATKADTPDKAAAPNKAVTASALEGATSSDVTNGGTPEKAPAKAASPKETPAKTAAPKQTPAKDATAKDTPAKDATPKNTPAKAAAPKDTLAKAAAPKDTPAKAAAPKETPTKAAAPKETPAKAAAPKETPAKAAAPKETPAKTAGPKQTPAQPNTESPAPKRTPAKPNAEGSAPKKTPAKPAPEKTPAKPNTKSPAPTKSPRDIIKPVVPNKKAPIVSTDESNSPAQKRKQEKEVSKQAPAKRGKLEYIAFVNRLSRTSTPQSLTEALSPYGSVIDVDMVRKGHNRVFAFVSFSSAAALDKAVAAKTVTIDKKKVYINRKTNDDVYRVKITKCPEKTTERLVKDALGAFGTVVKCKQLKFGFVVGLSTEEARKAVLEAEEVRVNGGAVEVEADEFDTTAVRHAFESKADLRRRKAAARAAKEAEAAEGMDVEEGDSDDGEGDEAMEEGSDGDNDDDDDDFV